MVPYLLAGLLLAQPTEQKQITALVAQIRRLAASEPVVYGIDTRLRAAEVLTAKYPKVAKDLLRDAQAALSGVTLPAEQDSCASDIVQRMAPLDLEEAERLIASIRRGGDEDYVAEAYDKLVEFLARTSRQHSRNDQRGVCRRAASAPAAQRRNWKTRRQRIRRRPWRCSLRFWVRFRRNRPDEKDVYYLLDCTKQIAGVNRPLAVEAIDQALSAAISEKLRDHEGPARRKMLREIASLLALHRSGIAGAI